MTLVYIPASNRGLDLPQNNTTSYLGGSGRPRSLLLSSLDSLSSTNRPFSVVQPGGLSSLRNRSKNVTLMGISDHYPALAVHHVNLSISRDVNDRVQSEAHNGFGLQSSVSFPGALPGVGLLSPVFAFDQQENTKILHRNGAENKVVQDLSLESLAVLDVEDRVDISIKNALNIGLYASTSTGAPGLETPTLLANAVVNAVLLPCVLLAVSAGAGVEAAQSKTLAIQKTGDANYRVSSAKDEVQTTDLRLGVKTICWLMWLSSVGFDMKNFMAPGDPKQNAQEIKKAPDLWKKQAVELSYGLRTQSQDTHKVSFDVDASSDKGKLELQNLIQSIHTKIDGSGAGKVEAKRSISHMNQQESKSGASLEIFGAVKAECFKKVVNVNEISFDEDGSHRSAVTRDESHVRSFKFLSHFDSSRSVHAKTSEVHLSSITGATSSMSRTKLGWTHLYPVRFSETDQSMSEFNRDVKFILEHPGVSEIEGPFGKIQDSLSANLGLAGKVELMVEFDADELATCLGALTIIKNETPGLYRAILSQDAESDLGLSSAEVAEQSFTQLDQVISSLSGLDKNQSVLERRFIQVFKSNNGKAKIKALAACLAPTLNLNSLHSPDINAGLKLVFKYSLCNERAASG